MPRRKPVRRCQCGQPTTAARCRECLEEDGAGMSEEELDALIAAQRPSMPVEATDRGAYKELRQERAQRTGSVVHLDPPHHRLIRQGKRWNGRTMA